MKQRPQQQGSRLLSLPHELQSDIFSWLYFNPETLKRCAVVCRALGHEAQAQLFSSFTIDLADPESHERLVDFFSAHIQSRIKITKATTVLTILHSDLSDVRPPPPMMESLLSHWPRDSSSILHRIVLRSTGIYGGMSPNSLLPAAWEALISLVKGRVVDVEWDGWQQQDFPFLIQILTSASEIDALSLIHFPMTKLPPANLWQFGHVLSPKILYLYQAKYLNVIVDKEPPLMVWSRCQGLSIECDLDESHAQSCAVPAILAKCATTLEDFRWCPSFEDTYNIPSTKFKAFRYLHTLTLSTYVSHIPTGNLHVQKCITWLREGLLQLPNSDILKTVRLVLHPGPVGGAFMSNEKPPFIDEVAMLDEVFGIPCLQHVSFCLYVCTWHDNDDAGRSYWILGSQSTKWRRSLPNLEKRGLFNLFFLDMDGHEAMMRENYPTLTYGEDPW